MTFLETLKAFFQDRILPPSYVGIQKLQWFDASSTTYLIRTLVKAERGSKACRS